MCHFLVEIPEALGRCIKGTADHAAGRIREHLGPGQEQGSEMQSSSRPEPEQLPESEVSEVHTGSLETGTTATEDREEPMSIPLQPRG